MIDLFSDDKQKNLFTWSNIRSAFLRGQYNELLSLVLEKDKNFIVSGTGFQLPGKKEPPNYYNPNYCLTLVNNDCNCDYGVTGVSAKPTSSATADAAKSDKKATGAATEAAALNPKGIEKECCEPFDNNTHKIPQFLYVRSVSKLKSTEDELDASIQLYNQLNFGSVLWLYYYERMGIFEILQALLKDYNYEGRLPISSKAEKTTSETTLRYSELMEMLSSIYRMGFGSFLTDRKALYQRTLGVAYMPENEAADKNVHTEMNGAFMRNFDKVLDLMLDFYRDKQLALAISQTSNSGNIRSSVATQTSIRDTIQVLQKNMEVFEYGRNRLTAFLGIATVFGTICLLRMLRDEIGVPRQYDEPHEFIPAAYDILIKGRSVTSTETNRFTIFDNCASYGYRLLTDIELINIGDLKTIALNSNLDAWLNDIEGNVQGYHNARRSVAAPVMA
jgi:hypothetical protein